MSRATGPRRSVLLLLGAALAACTEAPSDSYQGYVEGEYVYIASLMEGELELLAVTRGRTVEQGAELFRLDPNPQALRVAELEQRLEQARAKLADISEGSRPSELAALAARLTSARSGLERAELDFARRRELVDAGHTDAVSGEELDRYRIDRDIRASDVASLEAELETARLGGRSGAVAAAGNEVGALEASLQELLWQLDQKQATSPSAGIVQDTLYRVGEFVPAGRPVISLLPPENIKIRFFVPQASLPTIALGDPVRLHLDGLDKPARAEISFISSLAEFTPPVIYSKESRTKLVFMVEAVPDWSILERLRPGQPLEVYTD